MKIVKHSGDIVTFDKNKLKSSLEASGAEAYHVQEVLSEVEKQLYEGMSTKKIYRLAFRLLKRKSKATAARYNLKSAIQALGPAGFFFEKFMARVFENDGYQTQLNVVLQGKSVSHEIDVMLMLNEVVGSVECKFHSNVDTKSDVKIPMYIYARSLDLKDGVYDIFNGKYAISETRIVTNTRFSTDAVKFAQDYGLLLLGWDYPYGKGIKNKIDQCKLYPVTCLTTLTAMEKERLLIQDVVLVRDLLAQTDILYKSGVHQARIKNIIKEASELCGYPFH